MTSHTFWGSSIALYTIHTWYHTHTHVHMHALPLHTAELTRKPDTAQFGVVAERREPSLCRGLGSADREVQVVSVRTEEQNRAVVSAERREGLEDENRAQRAAWECNPMSACNEPLHGD